MTTPRLMVLQKKFRERNLGYVELASWFREEKKIQHQ